MKGDVLAGQRWIVVADSPFLPPRGGGEREHLGFITAAAEAGVLALLVVPGGDSEQLDDYREVTGGASVVATRRRQSPLLLAHPRLPYVVASRPAPRWLPARARALAPDATGVIVFSYKARRLGEALARGLGLPAVLRQHNREGAYHASLAAQTPGPRGLVLRWEARRIGRDELRVGRAGWLAGTADISAADARWRAGTGARGVAHVPPFALGVGRPAPPRDGALAGVPHLLFLGTLDTATNTGALDWFLRGAWPVIRDGDPDVVLDVVGRGPSPALRRRLAALDRVNLAADVPDIGPYLARAAVAVNPVVDGSGVNIKVVEYLDAGLPLVSTSLATQGLPLRPGVDLLVEDEPDLFGKQVLRLLADRGAAAELAQQGREHVRRLLDPSVNLRRLARMLHGVPVDGE